MSYLLYKPSFIWAIFIWTILYKCNLLHICAIFLCEPSFIWAIFYMSHLLYEPSFIWALVFISHLLYEPFFMSHLLCKPSFLWTIFIWAILFESHLLFEPSLIWTFFNTSHPFYMSHLSEGGSCLPGKFVGGLKCVCSPWLRGYQPRGGWRMLLPRSPGTSSNRKLNRYSHTHTHSPYLSSSLYLLFTAGHLQQFLFR